MTLKVGDLVQIRSLYSKEFHIGKIILIDESYAHLLLIKKVEGSKMNEGAKYIYSLSNLTKYTNTSDDDLLERMMEEKKI